MTDIEEEVLRRYLTHTGDLPGPDSQEFEAWYELRFKSERREKAYKAMLYKAQQWDKARATDGLYVPVHQSGGGRG